MGGGPVGAVTAYLLAKEGVKVHIIEPRSPFIREEKKNLPCTGCAGLLQRDALDLLGQLGLYPQEEVIRTRLKEINLHIPGRDEIVHIPTEAVSVYRGDSPVHQLVSDNIHSFDAWLLREAIGKDAIFHEAKAKSIQVENGSAKIISSSGEEINADLIIGAYGYDTIQTSGLQQIGKKSSIPVTKKAGVREFRIHKDLDHTVHILAHPTEHIQFAMILPKADQLTEEGVLVTVALMGKGDIRAQDYNELFDLPVVKNLLGDEINLNP